LDELLDEVLRRFQQAIRLQSQSNETYAIDTIVNQRLRQIAARDGLLI